MKVKKWLLLLHGFRERNCLTTDSHAITLPLLKQSSRAEKDGFILGDSDHVITVSVPLCKTFPFWTSGVGMRGNEVHELTLKKTCY